MSKIYYVNDPNGKYFSEDRTYRYTRMNGKEAYAFFKMPEEKNRRFMKTTEFADDGEDIYVEVCQEGLKEFRQDERREQYVSDSIQNSEYTLISLDHCGDQNGIDIGEETLADDEVNVERDVFLTMDILRLRKAALI